MKENIKNCGCGSLSQITFCDDETQTSSGDVEVVAKADMILPTDQLLIIRQDCHETKVYKASIDDLSPETALVILTKAVRAMPKTDPADGKSLWVKDGCLTFASGDPRQLGTIAPVAMKQSLKEAFKTLPTSDPGDGSPWLNGNVLMQGSNISNKGMNK